MSAIINILGVAGSLCRARHNRGALRQGRTVLPRDAKPEVFEVNDIPRFNPKEEHQPLARVSDLNQRGRAADANLFATPEYKYSIFGVLKNAVDWASRRQGR